MRTSTVQLAFVLGVVLALWLRGPLRDHAVASTTYEDIYYLPPADWLPVLSMGYRHALADVLLIRSLVYVGEEYHQRGGADHVFDYMDGVLALDPRFEGAYHWVATAGLYQTEGIGREEVVRTLATLERGVAELPESGLLEWDLGATYAFEAPPYAESPAERDAWLLAGADHLMRASRLGAAPPWAVLSNARLLLRVGENERAIEHLEEMYSTVDDPTLREEIALRIAEMRNDTYANAFVEEADAIEERRLRELPYVHPELYFVLGPRPPADEVSSLRDGFAAHAFDDEIVLHEED